MSNQTVPNPADVHLKYKRSERMKLVSSVRPLFYKKPHVLIFAEGDETMAEKRKEDEKKKYELVIQALENLAFGELHITIHNGKIVQINRIEKQRFSV
jgi:hypothetical protein